MNKKINGSKVVHTDYETGEEICITEGCTEIKDNNKTESEKRKEAYVKNNEINFCKDVGFVKLHDDVINVLVERLTPNEFAFFMRLSQYVSYVDCIIRRTSHGNSSIMDMKMMSEEMDIGYSNIRKLVSSLKKKGLIGLHETGSIGVDSKTTKAYTVNPFVMFRGSDVNKTVISFYDNSGWNEYLTYHVKKKKQKDC